MHTRHGFAGLAALLLLVGLVPPQPVRAALPAPVLLSPVGTTESDVIVDFNWERVEGAVAYRLTVQHASASGIQTIGETTVNDRFIGVVSYAGDTAYWTVAAIDGDGIEGPASGATFTSAGIGPEPAWPPDGATLDFPNVDPVPEWTAVRDQPDGLFADQAISSADPVGNPPSEYGLGAWRWQIRSTRAPSDPLPASPPSAIRTFTLAWPGAMPVQTAPADGAAVALGETPRLEWNRVPGAALYAWEIGRPGQPPFDARYSGARANWADITALLAPGIWQWRVRAIMSGTVLTSGQPGPWSGYRTIVVGELPPLTLVSPADGAVLTSWPVLRWSDVEGARSYTIQVADSPSLEGPSRMISYAVTAFSFGAPWSAQDMYAATTTTATRYWRVRADAAIYAMDPGEWSPWRSFTVEPAGGTLADETPATLLGPADCRSDACADIDGIPLLRWSPVATAASYRVFLRWDGGDGPASSWIDTASTGLALSQYNVLTPGDRAAWAVLACPMGGCSTTMPAPRWHFRIGLPVPEQLGPAGDIVQREPSVSMQWARVTGPSSPDAVVPAIDYELQYRLTPGAGTPQDQYFDYPGRATEKTVDGIRNGITLDWRVRAVTSLGAIEPATGAWSPWRSVTRQEPSITLLSPTEGKTVDSMPTLEWQGLDYPVLEYRVELARTSAIDTWGTAHWDWAANTGALSVRPGELAPGTYRWRVQRQPGTYFQEDGEGPWSVGYFTVEGDPLLHPVSPAPGDNVRADDAVLTWDPWPRVSYYSLMIGSSPDMTWDTAIYVGHAASNVHPVAETLPTGTLYWRVCSSIDCSDVTGFSAGSSPVQALFVTAVPGPDHTAPVARVVSVAPRSGGSLSADGSTPAIVTWTSADVGRGIASQQVQVRRGTGGWAPVSVSSSARSARVALRSNTTYAVRVRATDKAGNVGSWATFEVRTKLRQETGSRWRWSGAWTRTFASGASGGATRWARHAGATASMTITARSIALVAPRSAARGSAQVWIDGARVATIKLDSSPTGSRRIAFVQSWPSAGEHRITIKVNGTAGHPRVDVDALVSFR